MNFEIGPKILRQSLSTHSCKKQLNKNIQNINIIIFHLYCYSMSFKKPSLNHVRVYTATSSFKFTSSRQKCLLITTPTKTGPFTNLCAGQCHIFTALIYSLYCILSYSKKIRKKMRALHQTSMYHVSFCDNTSTYYPHFERDPRQSKTVATKL